MPKAKIQINNLPSKYGFIMAQAYTKKGLQEITVTDYQQIRSYVKTGDLFFSSGSYLFSGIIQRLTKSVWSHVAIVYKDEELGRVLILEAEPYVGIRMIPLSKYLHDYKGKRKPYKGQVVLAQLNEQMAQEKLNKVISFGLDELTRPYDNFEIVRIMMRILLRIGRRQKNKNYICSELVRDAYARAGTYFKYNDSYISPQEIWKDDRVDLKWRLL